MTRNIIKYTWNFAVVLVVALVFSTYAHSFEQWSIDTSLSALNVTAFKKPYSIDVVRAISTLFIGIVLGMLIALLILEKHKFLYAILVAVLLGIYSFIIRKTYWEIEPSLFLLITAEIRHTMYLLGAIVGVSLTQATKSRLFSSIE